MFANDFPPGFADPVIDSQSVFRSVLHAFSHPGTVCEISLPIEPPALLTPATAAVALALFDHETPVWLQATALEPWLRFHCGSPIARTPAEARFAIVHDLKSLPELEAFDHGSDEYPDRSATLILQVDAFTDSGLVLTGPGIRDSAAIGIPAVRTEFWKEREALAPLFPLGIDLLFTVGTRLVALPRTTRIGG
jgi:alpha-D-ribose 1-methylphosphonate 5-triphosphate synthase subunit PhnH